MFYLRSLYDVLADLLEEILGIVCVSIELDRLREVKAEYTHNRLSIYSVSAGNKINVEIVLHHDVYEILDIVDRLK